jgi:PAS domain-containing protein
MVPAPLPARPRGTQRFQPAGCRLCEVQRYACKCDLSFVLSGSCVEHVHRLIGKEGEYRWFRSLIATVKDEGGKVVALHGLMMDAHTIVLAEQTVRQEQKRLRRFVDAMPAMIWRGDTGGQIGQ